MLLSIHVRNKDDPDVVVHKISPDMTVQEVLSYVMKKRNLKQSDNWGMYEIVCGQELQRPLHYTEKVSDNICLGNGFLDYDLCTLEFIVHYKSNKIRLDYVTTTYCY